MAVSGSISGYYDPANVRLILGGVQPTDIAPDTMYVVSKDEDRVLPNVGVLGEVAIARNRNLVGTLTVSLKQTSSMNETFLKWYELSSTGLGYFTVTLVDPASGMQLDTLGWVQTQPDFTMGKEISQLDWVIGLANCEFTRWTGSTTLIDQIVQATNV